MNERGAVEREQREREREMRSGRMNMQERDGRRKEGERQRIMRSTKLIILIEMSSNERPNCSKKETKTKKCDFAKRHP